VQAGIRACDLAWGRTGKGRKNEQVAHHVSSVTLVTTRSMCVTVDFSFFSLSVATHTCSLAWLEASAESQLANSTILQVALVPATVCATVLDHWLTGARESGPRTSTRVSVCLSSSSDLDVG
jgi:hypothetical protein